MTKQTTTRVTSSAEYKANNAEKESSFLTGRQQPYRANYQTKTMRKAQVTQNKQESLTTPTRSDQMLKGYQVIMSFLSRGCDVQTA